MNQDRNAAVSIRIDCACGQPYEFEVEPVDGRMPSAVGCPTCGADGTAAANEFLAKSSTPQVSAGYKIAAQTVPPRRTPGLRQPINDEVARDFLEAKVDIARARSAALIVAGLDILVFVLSLSGFSISDVDRWILVDIAVVLGLAYGIHRFSRVCAVLMCLYYLAAFILMLKGTGIAGIIIRGVFFYWFARGAQAMFTYHKLKERVQ